MSMAETTFILNHFYNIFNINQRLDKVEDEDIPGINKRIDELEFEGDTNITNINNAIQGLNTDVVSLSNDVGTLKTNVSTLDEEIEIERNKYPIIAKIAKNDISSERQLIQLIPENIDLTNISDGTLWFIINDSISDSGKVIATGIAQYNKTENRFEHICDVPALNDMAVFDMVILDQCRALFEIPEEVTYYTYASLISDLVNFLYNKVPVKYGGTGLAAVPADHLLIGTPDSADGSGALTTVPVLNATSAETDSGIVSSEFLNAKLENLDIEAGVKAKYYQNEQGEGILAIETPEVQDSYVRTEPWLYEGRELSEYSWADLQAMCEDGNFKDIRVGDYKTITLTTGEVVQMQIAGIDTYIHQYPEISHHIDWISINCLNGSIKWNESEDKNNGSSEKLCPWLSSFLYLHLNEIIYNYLPDDIKTLIVQKISLIEGRYSDSGTLVDSNSIHWEYIGKLWIPSEYEVYGSIVWGTKGYSCGMGVQYPLFANNLKHRIKYKGSSDLNRCTWWLINPASGYSTQCCCVNSGGYPDLHNATADYISVPLCFRFSGS